jgi:hypothetical protein
MHGNSEATGSGKRTLPLIKIFLAVRIEQFALKRFPASSSSALLLPIFAS